MDTNVVGIQYSLGGRVETAEEYQRVAGLAQQGDYLAAR